MSLVHETGEALSEIVGQVGAIDGNVRRIVESAREQATGLREINSAVNEMDQGTQQNAAIVEESSAASHSLASELASLLQQLRQFDIGAPASRPVANVQRPAAVRPVRQASNAVRAELPAHTHDPGWAEF